MSEEDIVLKVVRHRLMEQEPCDENHVENEGGTSQASTHPGMNTQRDGPDRMSPTLGRADVPRPDSGIAGAFRVRTDLSRGGSQHSIRLDKHGDDTDDVVDDDDDDASDLNNGSNRGEGGRVSRRVSLRTSTLLASMGGNGANPYFAEATLVVENNTDRNLEDGTLEKVPGIVGTSDDLVVTAKPVVSNRTKNRRIDVGTSVLALVVLGVVLGILVPNNSKARSAPAAGAVPPIDESVVVAFAPDPICGSHIPLETDVSLACPDPASLPQVPFVSSWPCPCWIRLPRPKFHSSMLVACGEK